MGSKGQFNGMLIKTEPDSDSEMCPDPVLRRLSVQLTDCRSWLGPRNHIRLGEKSVPVPCLPAGDKTLEGKSFKLLDGLQSHQSIHWDKPAYRCTMCYKQFMREDDLRHHKLAHLIEPFQGHQLGIETFQSRQRRDTRAPCPICKKELSALSEHLKKIHFVKNDEERLILLKFARHDIGIRTSPCPVPGCFYHKTHLQRHLKTGHRNFTVEQREFWTQQAKTAEATRRLAALRATNPAIPVMTNWDLEDEPQAYLEDAGSCVKRSCKEYLVHAQREINKKNSLILQMDLKICKLKHLIQIVKERNELNESQQKRTLRMRRKKRSLY